MKKTLKRVLSVVCAIALVVTSMTGLHTTKVEAASTTTAITTGDADADARTALLAEIASEDYNFALGKEAAVSSLTANDGGTDLGIITNGTFATGNSKETIIEIGRGNSTDSAWVQVDLGNAYDTSKIDRVAVQYKTNGTSPKSGYTISYSLNGMSFVDVATVDAIAGSANQIYLDKITLSAEQAEQIAYAKYVRVTATKPGDTQAYGMQVKGMAVLTDGTTKVSEVEYQEVEMLDDPASLTVTSSDYGQLEYVFEAAEGHDDYTYYAFIDGVQQTETVTPGTTYTVTGLAAGEHVVKIMSFKDGAASNGIKETVTVEDTKSLLTGERNLALGKHANPSSIRDNDDPTRITDGALNATFRTATADTVANIVIDLGQNYRLDAIERVVASYAANRYPKSYTIDYSLNGITFETVAVATADSELQTVAIDASECTLQAVKYVRFSLSEPVGAGYGFQMQELGVIAKEGADLTPVEVEKVLLDEPASLTVTSSDYSQLEYIFEAAEGHDDYTYYAFVNDVMGTEPVEPNTKYVINDLAAGTYEIRVISFKDGDISDGISGSVDVQDYMGLFASEKNIAAGKSATATSIRTDDAESQEERLLKLTDGVISGNANTDTYRTLQNEANVSIVIDLGSVHKAGALERLVMICNTGRYAEDYTVECSLDGETYEQIGSVTGASSEISAAELSATQIEMTQAQYVRINFTKAAAVGYGYQIYEIAIIENEIDIAEAEISMPESVSYAGEAVEPEITLTYKDKPLVINKDYELVFSNNTEVGTANVTINGLGRYIESVEKTFAIVKQDVANVTINTVFDENNDLVVGLVNGNVEMVVDTDYTYEVGTDEEGNVTVTVTGMGNNYTGTYVKTILLADVPVNEAVDLSAVSPDLNQIEVQFGNADKLGAASQTYDVYVDDELVAEGVEAGTYTYDEQTVGTHTVKVVADLVGKKSAGVTTEVSVNGMDISGENAEVIAEEVSPEYTGSEHTIGITVKYNGEDLVEGTDYIVEYSDNVVVGTANYVVSGIGLYEGTVEGSFDIVKKNIAAEDVVVSVEEIAPEYNGLAQTIGITVTYGKLTLVEGVDYTVEFSNNINAGTAKFEITGIGYFEGTVSGEFTISSKGIAASDVVVSASFNAKKEVVVVVKDGEKTLVEGVDYSFAVTTDADYNVTVTITALKGNYSGTNSVTIAAKDNPNTPQPTTVAPTGGKDNPTNGTSADVAKVKKVKAKKLNAKKVKVTWKKIANANGYEVRYSTSKKFKKVTVKTVKKNKAAYTIKKLKGKKYFIQVRAYVLKDGAKSYGAWSKAKKVKMK